MKNTLDPNMYNVEHILNFNKMSKEFAINKY